MFGDFSEDEWAGELSSRLEENNDGDKEYIVDDDD
jgi:hypothetical protein